MYNAGFHTRAEESIIESHFEASPNSNGFHPGTSRSCDPKPSARFFGTGMETRVLRASLFKYSPINGPQAPRKIYQQLTMTQPLHASKNDTGVVRLKASHLSMRSRLTTLRSSNFVILWVVRYLGTSWLSPPSLPRQTSPW